MVMTDVNRAGYWYLKLEVVVVVELDVGVAIVRTVLLIFSARSGMPRLALDVHITIAQKHQWQKER